jgi:putative acetyltransferase
MERKANEHDFEVVYEIYMDEENNPYMTFEIMTREDFQPLYTTMLGAEDLWVYEVEGRVAAAYRIIRKQHRTSHTAYFGSFAVHPQFRGRGLGKAIMVSVIERLKSDGVKRLELVVVCDNDRAINFYKRLGFKVEGVLKCFLKRADSDQYLDDLAMALIME